MLGKTKADVIALDKQMPELIPGFLSVTANQPGAGSDVSRNSNS